ncbi:MAG: flavodoxin-dependent (E)-4-hydroxy-3-methylbut-2-enyl-diphosphate synthase [Candidatus Brocadiales bacterium]|nr:flavodoxin-dependent (E)-4-hydroxy-3-methylbut-2-enyl-diphosphate synthase [Candidatus Bathyanammoxibius amoris]
MIERRRSRAVRVGGVQIGGDAPVSLQSMTKTHTTDIKATVEQIKELEELGCEIIRAAAPTREAARCLGEIKRQVRIPLVADIHFSHRMALDAIEQGVDKIRINPGNMKDRKKVEEVVRAAKNKGVAIRIGVNSGSIRARGEEDAPMADLMVNAVLRYCEHFESLSFRDIVLSLKASDVQTTMDAYRRVAKECDYPLHLGITAAGPASSSIMKSAIGIGGLLSEGIGDTLRVSITGHPTEEIKAGKSILEALGLRETEGWELISCPMCGRCEIDLETIVEEVMSKLPPGKRGLQIAIMGCAVNGPGEAQECDIGIAGGHGFGLLFKRGEMIRKIPESEMVTQLLKELDEMSAPTNGGSGK